MTTSGGDSLAFWLKRISEEEMPALSGTAAEIANLTEADDCHMQRLSDIILQDAAMTGQVLRMTNSAYHIRRSNRTNTVSRAVVMLGFDEVRSICLTIAVLDQFKKQGSHSRLTKEMANAFHAATQARMLAVQRGDPASEEVFIAALLRHLGNMAFWCFGGDKAEALAEALETSDENPEEIEEKILGFPLKQLTWALSQEWGLGKLLQEATKNESSSDPRTEAINLSHKFVRAMEKGADSPEVQSLLTEISEYAGASMESVHEILQDCAKEAVEMAQKFGAEEASSQIALPELAKSVKAQESAPGQEDQAQPDDAAAAAPSKSETEPEPEPVEEEEIIECPEPNPMRQLAVLRELSELMQNGTDVHEVLETILLGIFKGVGMDRALFALLSPNRKYLRAKSALGVNRKHLLENFKFEVTPEAPNIFQVAIEGKKAVWIDDRTSQEMKELLPNRIVQVIGHSPFFVAPTIVAGRPIGVFYTDRRESGRDLDNEAFEAFKQFVFHANLSLEHLGQNRN